MPFWTTPPPPRSKLERYRLLSPNASVRVSPLCLGAMSIGDKWNNIGFGDMSKEKSFELLDAYFDLGGNFIDTANSYQDETSEKFIGDWMEQRGNRDQMIIATKYTTNFKRRSGIEQQISFMGNGHKSLHVSLEASLRKLRTSYIDILYVHWWDWDTSIEEVMNSLHHYVSQGKVLYLGVSDTPAWVVSQANQYAKDHGKTPFSIYQGLWNVMDRSFEREIIPMARTHGIALAPWNVLNAGKFRTDEEEERRREANEGGRDTSGTGWERNEEERKMSKALEKVAGEVGTKSITAVAIAYVMQKTPYVFPIIGGRKVEHLKQNLEALDITLTPEQIEYLESIVPFNPGFPATMIGLGKQSDNVLVTSTANIDRLEFVAPLRPKN